MKVYISGPMTGYVEHNFPAFHRAAEHLRSLGYDVVSPAELDDPGATHEELAKIPHWWFLRRDLRVLLDCDAIYLLPGWRWSKGATLEAEVAKGTGILRLEDDDEIWRTFEGEPVSGDAKGETCGATQGPIPKLGGVTLSCVKGEGHDLPHEDADGSWWEPDLFADIGYAVDPSLPPNTIEINGARFETKWDGTDLRLVKPAPEPVISRDYLHNFGNAIDESIDKHHRRA